MPLRPVCIHHGTSLPYRFFGRGAELALLDEAFLAGGSSVVAFIGPGGQGKTAIVQHWLEGFLAGGRAADGVFLWSFYRGKDADLCLRQLYAYAHGLDDAPDVSATYCVDRLLPVLRRERWVVVLDGAEVAQVEHGPWLGRFLHPELGRLLEELASAPLPGVVAVTTRFPLPELERRKYARAVSLGGLDRESACNLLTGLGVRGDPADLDAAAGACGFHAKAVELLGTYLARFASGAAARFRDLEEVATAPGLSDEESRVAWVMAAYQRALPPEAQDILALATAFRDPPAEAQALAYLASTPVRNLLHTVWGRTYPPFAARPAPWLTGQLDALVRLRLLERIRVGGREVLDAHPLVRRSFEHVLGVTGRRQSARARAGFLRGRPDRRRPATLEQAREEVELFHAHCDAGLWNEADGTYLALDNPKHRFLAPALERDLLVRFFPEGDWRQPPCWPGFGRYRSLAICLELLGQFDDALEVYRPADAALRGDALLALGRLDPLLRQVSAGAPWETLWQSYRVHALSLSGSVGAAVALARTLVPVDVYEWVHLFEGLLRAGRLDLLDLRSLLYTPPHAEEHRWAGLARRRMRLDYQRLREPGAGDLVPGYRELLEEYDRGGLPYERGLTRLGFSRLLGSLGRADEARQVVAEALDLARRHRMRILEADALELIGESAEEIREASGYHGPGRP